VDPAGLLAGAVAGPERVAAHRMKDPTGVLTRVAAHLGPTRYVGDIVAAVTGAFGALLDCLSASPLGCARLLYHVGVTAPYALAGVVYGAVGSVWESLVGAVGGDADGTRIDLDALWEAPFMAWVNSGVKIVTFNWVEVRDAELRGLFDRLLIAVAQPMTKQIRALLALPALTLVKACLLSFLRRLTPAACIRGLKRLAGATGWPLVSEAVAGLEAAVDALDRAGGRVLSGGLDTMHGLLLHLVRVAAYRATAQRIWEMIDLLAEWMRCLAVVVRHRLAGLLPGSAEPAPLGAFAAECEACCLADLVQHFLWYKIEYDAGRAASAGRWDLAAAPGALADGLRAAFGRVRGARA
jgi:hypothetical protein